MGAVTEWLNAVELTAESPDGSVRARVAGSQPLAVKLSPNAWQRHSENSLSEQVESVVQDVLVAYQETVTEWQFGGRDPVLLARAGDEFARRQLAFQRAVVEIVGTGSSTAKYVDVEWRGMADVRIRISIGAITRLSRSQLTGEIQSGIAAAGHDRSGQILAASERIHGLAPLPQYKGE